MNGENQYFVMEKTNEKFLIIGSTFFLFRIRL